MKNARLVIVICAAFALLGSMLTINPVKAPGPLQTLVDYAFPNQTIMVPQGTYTEHVIIDTTIAPNIKLKANGPPGTVILDGLGCTLPYGFELIGYDNIEIEGFTIQHYAVAGIFIHADYSAPPYDPANHNKVIDNDIKDNCNTGIVIENGNANSVLKNEVHDNSKLGVFINNGDKNFIRKNDIYDNGATGIELHIAQRTKVQKNDVHDNGGLGLVADGYSWGLSITANSFSFNGLGGIYVISGGNTIESNTIDNNGIRYWLGNGILLEQGDDNVVTGNEIYLNGLDGIMVSYSWWNKDPSDRNTITNNTVYDNRHGIFLYATDWNKVWNNTVYHNYFNGIQVTSAGTAIIAEHNTIYSNTATSNGWGYPPLNDWVGVDLYWDSVGDTWTGSAWQGLTNNHWGTNTIVNDNIYGTWAIAVPWKPGFNFDTTPPQGDFPA